MKNRADPFLARMRVAIAGMGCLLASINGATQPATPAPPQPLIEVTVTPDLLNNSHDRPSDAFLVPDSQVLIRATRYTGVPASMKLNPIALVLGPAIHGSSKRGIISVDVRELKGDMRFRLDDRLRAAIAREIADQHLQERVLISDTGSGRRLSVAAQMVLTAISDADVREAIEIRTTLPEPGSKELWPNRYFASSGLSRPFKGPGSWTENGGAALDTAIESSLQKAVHLMLTDVVTSYPRYNGLAVMVGADFPMISQKIEVLATKLWEDDQTMVVQIKLEGRPLLNGIYQLDRNAITVRPMETGDKYKILK